MMPNGQLYNHESWYRQRSIWSVTSSTYPVGECRHQTALGSGPYVLTPTCPPPLLDSETEESRGRPEHCCGGVLVPEVIQIRRDVNF